MYVVIIAFTFFFSLEEKSFWNVTLITIFLARIDDFLFVCVVFFGCCFSDLDFRSERIKSVVRNDEF
jgi:hypothetical protein